MIPSNMRTALLVALFALGLAMPAGAADIADAFKGKQVKIIVGFGTGGGYDVYARVLAQFLPKHIPGSPTVIVQNMAGAGSLTALNFLYTKAERDGTVIGVPSNSMAFAPLQGMESANFDPTKFNWIGSPNQETGILISWHTAPVKTVQELMTKEITVGVSAGTSSFFGRVLNATLGLKQKLILGYPDSTASFLAMERGEVDGYPSIFWSSLKSTKPEWLRDKSVNLLVQYGPAPNREIAAVPFARDLAKTEEDKQLLDVSVAALAFGRPFMLPPEVPAERVAAIRQAFLDTYKDPAFLAEAAKLQLEVDPVTGDQMQELLKRTYASPKPVIDRLRQIYKESSEAK
jgi:tripartite-type tricarboxylate transporter receptor subunit TctC